MTEQATTTAPPAKDWREFVEEKTKAGSTVLDAHCYDGKWYGLAKTVYGDMSAVDIGLIIKPQPKTTRPWTPDEVPLGEVVKCKRDGERHILLSNDNKCQSVWVANYGLASLQELHDNCLLELTRPSGSTLGTYGVCGVEE